MRFTKPQWLSHAGEKKDHEVYSCHVSPDGTRLATAAGDGHVRIWSVEAIVNASDPSYTKPKQLASLSHHSGTVHSVRFSPNGKWLASGADDRMVCIYSLDRNPAVHTTFGNQEAAPVENWRVYRRLTGHDNDVQDIGWSYDSSILVSVGLDSKVVVWSGYTFEKLKTLANHQSHVKGITFDPANKYFATASDDRTIRVYRFKSPESNATAYDQTSNFTLEATIAAPFASSPNTTYFRRCSWSPEGEHIAAANAVNGPVSSIAIINRGAWASEINLIGHEGPVEVCAFSPRLFFKERPPPGEERNYPAVTVVACAGQDKTLSVWNTSYPRPFVVTGELSSKPITDLAWTPGGETLFFSSLDGTIAALIFNEGELGYPAPGIDNQKALDKFGTNKTNIPEGTDALRLEETSKAGDLKDAEGRMGELMGDVDTPKDASVNSNMRPKSPSEAQPITPAIPNGTSAPKDNQADRVDKLKQRVTITKDGKKRIAPLLVSSSNVGEANLPRAQLQSAVRNGVNLDEPTKIIDLSKPYEGLPKGGLASLVIGNKRKYAEVDGNEERRIESRVHAVQQSGAIPVVNNTEDGLRPAVSGDSARTAQQLPDVLRPAIVNPSLTVSQVRLAVPLVRNVVSRPLDFMKANPDHGTNNVDVASDSDSSVVFEARNASGPSRTGRVQDKEPTRITVSKRSQILWQDFLPKAVLLVTGNNHFWVAACEDGSLYIWTPAGRRLLNASVLESQPVILDCRGWWLLAMTAAGQCYVWNIKAMRAAHPPISLAPVLDLAAQSHGGHLTAGPSLVFARLNSLGRIVVGMSNGDGYSYNAPMYIWQRLSESWWAVGSQYWNTTDTSISSVDTTSSANGKHETDQSMVDGLNPENISVGIIPLLERNTTSQALLKGRAYFLQRLVKQLLSAEGYESFETLVSIAHLENRVAAAKTLGAKDEFRMYLIMYAKRIGAEGARGKVEELLKSLMGPIFEDSTGHEQGAEEDEVGAEWGGRLEICGWKRQALLKEVVMVLGKYRDLQRLTVPYAQCLGIVGDMEITPDGTVMITEE